MFIDLENIVHAERMAGDSDAAVARVQGLLATVREDADLVYIVAVCDPWLARALGPALHALGVRVFPHRGGVDEADHRLIERLAHDVPASCSLLVIASGDHAFTDAAIEHRNLGRRVQVFARSGSIAADLYRVVDDFIHLDPSCREHACTSDVA